jgi:hypothetical protein
MFHFSHPQRRSAKAAFWRYGSSLTLVWLVLCQSGWAQANISDWNKVEVLDPGSGIWVRTMAGKKYHGELVRVTDEMLWINSDEPNRRWVPGRRWIQRPIPRANVKEVRRFSQAAPAVVGAVIGGAIGVGIGAGIDASTPMNDDPHLAAFVFGMLGAMFGGALASSSTIIKGNTVYRAP